MIFWEPEEGRKYCPICHHLIEVQHDTYCRYCDIDWKGQDLKKYQK